MTSGVGAASRDASAASLERCTIRRWLVGLKPRKTCRSILLGVAAGTGDSCAVVGSSIVRGYCGESQKTLDQLREEVRSSAGFSSLFPSPISAQQNRRHAISPLPQQPRQGPCESLHEPSSSSFNQRRRGHPSSCSAPRHSCPPPRAPRQS